MLNFMYGCKYRGKKHQEHHKHYRKQLICGIFQGKDAGELCLFSGVEDTAREEYPMLFLFAIAGFCKAVCLLNYIANSARLDTKVKYLNLLGSKISEVWQVCNPLAEDEFILLCGGS